MIVGINALDLAPGHGGRQVVIQKFLETLARIQPETGAVVFACEQNQAFYRRWNPTVVPGFGELPGAIQKSRVDVLLSPLETVLPHAPVPQVLLIMDLENYQQGDRRWRWMRGGSWRTAHQACMNAAAIITPSEFLKRQASEVLEAPMEKVVVAPPGVDAVFEEEQTPFIEAPYLLTVGSTRKGRNPAMLLDVMKRLWDEKMPHSLVVVGRAGAEEPQTWGGRVMRVESVPQNQLAALYQHSELTILPAAYAGSGLSVLEAMRAGVTVVCPRVGGIPEVAHTTPIYFNPDNAGDLAAAIRRGLSERPSERKNRHTAGRKLAREYDWETCTRKMLQALKRKP